VSREFPQSQRYLPLPGTSRALGRSDLGKFKEEKMQKRIRSLWSVVAIVAALAACGGQKDDEKDVCPSGTTGTFPNCTVLQTCTQTVVLQDGGPVESRLLYYNDFSVPDSGRLDITVDWTSAASPIGVYLVPANTCTIQEFNARTCNFLVRSEPSTQKPRKISTPNFAAGNYRWMMGTFGEIDESLSFQFVLSKGTGCAPLTGTSPQVSSRGEPLRIERMQPSF
jgi:hypothetical protein